MKVLLTNIRCRISEEQMQKEEMNRLKDEELKSKKCPKEDTKEMSKRKNLLEGKQVCITLSSIAKTQIYSSSYKHMQFSLIISDCEICFISSPAYRCSKWSEDAFL